MHIVDFLQFDCNFTLKLVAPATDIEKTRQARAEHSDIFCLGIQTADFSYPQDQLDVFCEYEIKKH